MPTRKVTAGAVAGAMVTVFTWLLQVVTGQEMPAEVAAALVTICTLAVSYYVPEAPDPEPQYFEDRKVGDLSIRELRTMLDRPVGAQPAGPADFRG